MKEDHQSLIAALSVNLVTVNLLLSVFFLPGVWAAGYCEKETHLSISAPKEIEALSGSCLLIPCSFNTTHTRFSTTRSIHGVWMKNNSRFSHNPSLVIFNSSKSVNTYPLNITGNLNQRNCTTLFPDLNTSYSDRYFFRIENGEFRATACADPLQITVKDSPWSPRINISGDLKEKDSVSITCSALTPCPLSPPELTWNLQPDSHRQTARNTDGTFTTKIQENITLSDTHDGYSISCSVRYPVDGGKGFKTAETEVTLHVSYAPKNTSASISPSGLVSAGSWVELSCSSRAKPPVSSFSWFRISSEGPVKVSEEQLYRFTITEGGEFYCVATNNLGNQTSSWIHLNNKGRSPVWIPVVAVILLVVFIGLVVSFCHKFRHQPPQTHQEVVVQVTFNKTEETEEGFHYEDVSFTKRRPQASSITEQVRGRQEETIYSQVKASKPENRSTLIADSPEDLYAQVKKK